MVELLREQPELVAIAVLLMVAVLALWLRRPGRPGTGSGPRGPADPDAMEDPTPQLRRARIQIVLAIFAILGFTVIGIVNSLTTRDAENGEAAPDAAAPATSSEEQ